MACLLRACRPNNLHASDGTQLACADMPSFDASVGNALVIWSFLGGKSVIGRQFMLGAHKLPRSDTFHAGKFSLDAWGVTW
jgi:hypothetical protein